MFASKHFSAMYKILKYFFGIGLVVYGLQSMFTDSFIGGLFLLFAGLVIIPPISKKFKEKFKFWQHKSVRIGSFISLLFIGSAIIGVQDDGFDTNNTKSKEEILISYIKEDTLDKSIQNIRELGSIGELFDNGNYSTVYPHQDYITEKYDSINNVTLLTFNPKFNFSNEEETKFLKSDKTKGKLKDYIMKFEIDDNDKIISKRTHITYSNGETKEFDNSDVPNYKSFIDTDLVEIMYLEKEALKNVAKIKEENNRRAEKFEDNCLSSWDGSHIALKRMIKDNLNDPKSFEHVKTTYRLYKDYAVVKMIYRGKNAFNATITNSVTAKVNIEDCSVLELNLN